MLGEHALKKILHPEVICVCLMFWDENGCDYA
jgi:hypothetical protein